MKRPTRGLHHFYQPRSQVCTLLCNVALLSYVDQRCFLTRTRAKLLKWSGERTGPTGQHAEEMLSGKKCVSLYFRTHWCSPCRVNWPFQRCRHLLCPNLGRKVVQQSLEAVTRTPEGRKKLLKVTLETVWAAFNATKPRRLHHGSRKHVLRTIATRAMTFVAQGKSASGNVLGE